MTNYFKLKKIGRFSPKAILGFLLFLYLLQITVGYIEFQNTGLLFGLPLKPILVLAPIYEELIFRGFILGAFMKVFSWKKAVIYSSLLFGLWHLKNIFYYEPQQVLTQVLYTGLFLGPILAGLTIKFKSIWPAVIVHYLNNIWSPISFLILEALV
jgi:membrane protease YdiL (CAAX protease family)